MKKSVFTMSVVLVLSVLSWGIWAVAEEQSMTPAGKHEMKHEAAQFDDKGALMMPTKYREWVFVGAPVTPNDMNDGKAAFPEFHDVYIDRMSFADYKKTGKFRDGTVLVKELVSVGAKKAASGNGYFPGDFSGIAVAVKESKRFAKEPGNWAYFSFATGKMTADALPTASCNKCHKDNAAEDWVFSQYYPVLKAAKKK